MGLFIIVEDTDGSSEPGTWVLGDSEEDVLQEAFKSEDEDTDKDYLIECETDHWHRLYEVEYMRDDDGNIEEMFDFYLGACTEVTSYLRTAESLTELQELILKADKHARALGVDLIEYVYFEELLDFEELYEDSSDMPEEYRAYRIWGWDETHLLVSEGDDAAGCRIIPRQDISAESQSS